MKIGTENKRQLIIAGVVGFFALLAIYPLYQELFGGTATPPPAPPVIRDASTGAVTSGSATASTPGFTPIAAVRQKAATRIGRTSNSLDPTLHMAAMLRAESVVYSGSGRNIFAAGPSQVLTAVRIPQPIAGPRGNSGPKVVLPVQPPQYQAPAIPLKFFGTATAANGVRRAFLLNGDNVFLASSGDVVDRRYKVVSIAANSITIEDLPNNNKQSLPLLTNY